MWAVQRIISTAFSLIINCYIAYLTACSTRDNGRYNRYNLYPSKRETLARWWFTVERRLRRCPNIKQTLGQFLLLTSVDIMLAHCLRRRPAMNPYSAGIDFRRQNLTSVDV